MLPICETLLTPRSLCVKKIPIAAVLFSTQIPTENKLRFTEDFPNHIYLNSFNIVFFWEIVNRCFIPTFNA